MRLRLEDSAAIVGKGWQRGGLQESGDGDGRLWEVEGRSGYRRRRPNYTGQRDTELGLPCTFEHERIAQRSMSLPQSDGCLFVDTVTVPSVRISYQEILVRFSAMDIEEESLGGKLDHAPILSNLSASGRNNKSS